MSQTLSESPVQVLLSGITLHLPSSLTLTDDQFFMLCQINRDLRLERTAQGDLIIMPPTGGETGNRNVSIIGQLYNWAKREGTGAAFDSSTGFNLPNGADRSPDAAWVSHERLAQLTPEQKRKFLPLCPDFVVELCSPNDKLETVQAKMKEYLANGARLGWLIEPTSKRVYLYRPGQPVTFVEAVNQLAADPELPGFTLELTEIWAPQL